MQQGGGYIVNQGGGASPIVQSVSSPVVQQNPGYSTVVQSPPTVVQQNPPYQTPAPVPPARRDLLYPLLHWQMQYKNLEFVVLIALAVYRQLFSSYKSSSPQDWLINILGYQMLRVTRPIASHVVLCFKYLSSKC